MRYHCKSCRRPSSVRYNSRPPECWVRVVCEMVKNLLKILMIIDNIILYVFWIIIIKGKKSKSRQRNASSTVSNNVGGVKHTHTHTGRRWLSPPPLSDGFIRLSVCFVFWGPREVHTTCMHTHNVVGSSVDRFRRNTHTHTRHIYTGCNSQCIPDKYCDKLESLSIKRTGRPE